MSRTPETKAWRSIVGSVAADKEIHLSAFRGNVKIESLGSVIKYLMTAAGGVQTIGLRIDALIRNAVSLDDYEHYMCHGERGLEAANKIVDLQSKSYYGVSYADLKSAIKAICVEIARRADELGLNYHDYVMEAAK
ncbi:hypothetical protein BVJ53_13845 [Lacticaseibacillus chiayiensis]|uniref:Uncharacterized protein n=1 Tax=Lacticaseibacillus chiayiensis TaxID=2100821 RepID=A0A4Q1TIQ0_9LACO|nr:hypothetical protein [Lacticaseibacillus chiayiensis]RXT17991.1 hypothetical protein BVJ53_13845 [Lacticaseibacillus chiayiensis]UYN55630.1 hypothetical protein OFW50_09020 [Lacticaseibacillus chiayiensis]